MKGNVRDAAYLVFLLIILIQFVTSISIGLVNAGFMLVPDYFWQLFISSVMLFLLLTVFSYRVGRDARDAIAADYRTLLNGIFMNEVDLPGVVKRYAEIKRETPSRLKFWKPRRKDNPETTEKKG